MIEHIVLGIIQGLTEFLPVSSSGHLVILKDYLQVKETNGVLLEVMLHLGTLLSIFAVFWKDILEIFRGTIISTLKLCSGCRPKEIWAEDQYTRLFMLILIGTIPTGIIALLFEDMFESLFNEPLLAAIAILITGLVLWLTKFIGVKNSGGKPLNIFHVLVIGTVQGIAITPGMSRSGLTISAASYMGVSRETAVRYSFLLSIPAIVGAVILQARKIDVMHDKNLIPLAAGAGTAFVVGYLALQFLIKIVQRGRLYMFAYYCWGFGFAATISFFLKSFYQ
ncbi:undecaprenyl-diphosphate phosphatase [Candidatus Kuenenia sp.]|uniref:undecaprenyl-diphosphate phosphatase n=1 Tax=Candidatus Kuenenia sp. TaxID=2499824 RepID=UPI00321F6896